MHKNEFLLLFTLLSLVACSNEESRLPSGNPLVATAQTNSILEYATHVTEAAALPVDISVHPLTEPGTPVVSVLNNSPDPLADFINSPPAPVVFPATFEGSPVVENNISDGSETLLIQINATFAGITPTCTMMDGFPLWPIDCEANSSLLLSRSGIETGLLKFNLSSESLTAQTPGLVTTKWIIKQVGNTSGSNLISDAYSSYNSNWPHMALAHNHLYFISNNSSAGQKLFRINSTDVVQQVTNVKGNQTLTDGIGHFGYGQKFGDKLMLTAEIATGIRKLFAVNPNGSVTWVTNARGPSTSDGVILIGRHYIYSQDLELNNEYYFRMNNSTGSKLHKLSANGTVTQVSNIQPAGNDAIVRATAFNNTLYFGCSPLGTNTHKLCKITSDNEIRPLSNLAGNSTTTDNLDRPLVVNNFLYFVATPFAGVTKLYRINTNDVLSRVSNTSGNSSVNDRIGSSIFMNIGHHLYFDAHNENGLVKLYRVNDAGDVTQVASTSGSPTTSDSYSQSQALRVGRTIYFAGNNSQGANKLFSYNDETDQLTQISNTRDDQNLSDTIGRFMGHFRDEVYFSALSAEGGRKLFKVTTDGKVVQVSNISANQSTHDILITTEFLQYNNALYFVGFSAANVEKLYKLMVAPPL
jgi:hypothetical protein